MSCPIYIFITSTAKTVVTAATVSSQHWPMRWSTAATSEITLTSESPHQLRQYQTPMRAHDLHFVIPQSAPVWYNENVTSFPLCHKEHNYKLPQPLPYGWHVFLRGLTDQSVTSTSEVTTWLPSTLPRRCACSVHLFIHSLSLFTWKALQITRTLYHIPQLTAL